MKQSFASRLFDVSNVILLTCLSIITLYPFWDSLIVSIIPLQESLASNIHLFPKTITWEAYAYIFNMKELWSSYGVSLFVTGVGTLLSMLMTVLAAYALSKSHLKGKRTIMFLIVFTMMFNGGLIPTYLVVKQLHLLNTVWALIIPTALTTYNLIIMRNFFTALPESLEESARIDGCNDLGVLFRIVVPLSMPAIATVALFYAVARWNEFFTAIMYITDKDKWPLQLFLRAMLVENEASFQSGGDNPFLMGQSMKMASVMVSTIPVLLIYPFFQKYFVQGVTLGAVKE
ncbi:carbohydrate ABC transporter permease [Paenibacillus hemerocallicola]|jgi:putative aldouronate transport system permease protein|uniref:Carbohydrate ABC transporter permease n=1 Tax=Paenibacillus hemerocallicola TaxID=1172614 RepID=A0A5C4T7H6_9BACL|nr:carbohydrate ABC transporter permease [Paenibacillus hemerocallicola]TNJ64951.1 carbohydrate ABC transporter permease [Paenibacillus hemerocallicola]